MIRATLKGMAARKRRLLATCSAVILGVAFLAGTLVMSDSTRAGFSTLFTDANAGTDAVIRSATEIGSDEVAQRGLLDQSLVDVVRAVDGVAAAEPGVEGIGQIVATDGDLLGGGGPPTLAAGWITDPRLNPYQIAEGRAPEAAGEVVIDKSSATDGDLAIGDSTTVLTPDPTPVTVVGIVTFGEVDSMSGVTFVGFTLGEAQRLLLPAPDKVTGVLVAASAGVSQADLVDRLNAVLPAGTEALTGAALTAENQRDIEQDFLGFLETFLLVFAGVALLVAMLSINNTFSILVAQRTRESALMRAIGASRRQILAAITFEAVVIGVVASAVGFVAGLGVAVGIDALISAAGSELPGEGFVIDGGTVIAAFATGTLVTLAASLAPALRASRVPPLAALRDVAVDRSSASRWRIGVGAVAAAGGTLLTVTGISGSGALARAGLGALLMVSGMVLLGPVVAKPASAGLGRLTGVGRGMAGALARRNAMRNPRRTASTATALMVGVSVVTVFTVLAASIKDSLDAEVSSSFRGDFVIATDSWSGSGLSPRLADDVAALPEVGDSTRVGLGALRLDGRDAEVSVSEPQGLAALFDIGVEQGDLAGLAPDQLAVSDTYAEDRGWALGTPVEATFVDGANVPVTVGAIYTERALVGDIVMPTGTWLPHTNQASDFAVFVSIADGVTLDDGRAAVQAVADRFTAPDVQDRDEFVAAQSAGIDQMLGVIYGLLVLAIVIALGGIANTLSLSTHERTRELGLLRAVGQTRAQLRAMVRGEAVIVALFGTVGGIGLGLFLGWRLVAAVAAAEGIGTLTVPTGQLLVVAVVGAVAGMVAAIRPARRAARLDVLAALATDG